MNSLLATNFTLPGQIHKYTGKVREVITLENDLLVMIATDRLSAFDVVMPKGDTPIKDKSSIKLPHKC